MCKEHMNYSPSSLEWLYENYIGFGFKKHMNYSPNSLEGLYRELYRV